MSVLDGASASATAPRRTRRGRGLVAVVIALVLLLGAAVVVDRIAADRAAATLGDILESSYGATDAEASIGGFPFLTQVASGTLQDVGLTAASATYEGIELTDITGTGTDIPFDLGTRTVGTAGTLSATATLPPASLETLVRQELAALEDVTLETRDGTLVAATEVLGALAVEVELVPRAADGQIAIDIGGVSIGGFGVPVDSLPAGLADQLTDIRIDIPALPAGLTLSQIDVVDGGVRVSVEGTDVDLSQR